MKELKKSVTPTGLQITEGSGNVFSDLGFSDEEAENLQVRSRLLSRLIDYVEEEKLTEREAAERLGVHQPRISQLMRGQVGAFSIDILVSMLARAGLHIKIDFEKRAA